MPRAVFQEKPVSTNWKRGAADISGAGLICLFMLHFHLSAICNRMSEAVANGGLQTGLKRLHPRRREWQTPQKYGAPIRS
jgi:hypothetical protein